MKDDETLLLRLAEEITTELDSLTKLRVEFENAPRADEDTYELRARASIPEEYAT
jgi:hypothetical protein